LLGREVSLLEFIFENPIAIIFIIGAIISFLKKMKENSNPNPNQEKKTEWKKVMNIPQTLNEGRQVETKHTRVSQEHPQTKGQLAQEYYDVKNKTEINQPKEYSRKDSSLQRKEMNKKVVNAEVDASVDHTPTKDTLIDGIVWAEILGPPRAYKSHSERRAPYRR
jgi:hypothetical protein